MLSRERPFIRDQLRLASTVAKMRPPHPSGHMNAAADTDFSEQQRKRRIRFELIFASLWLAFGLFVLPALIFMVGNAELGPYGEKAGLSTFYVDFYADLASASGRAWALAVGPLVLISLLRAIFIGVRSPNTEQARTDEDEESAPPPQPKPVVRKEPKRPARQRVEPRMGSE